MNAMKLEDGKYILTVKNGLAEVQERVEEYNPNESRPRKGKELRVGDKVTFNDDLSLPQVNVYSTWESWVCKYVKDVSAIARYAYNSSVLTHTAWAYTILCIAPNSTSDKIEGDTQLAYIQSFLFPHPCYLVELDDLVESPNGIGR